jgi:very-short-patch-repair endonuclease
MTVDFWWPSARVIGEFDGKGKYLREEYSGGRSIADIVIDEKLREDRLRALGATVVRWGWSEAASSARLLARLGNRLS